MLVNSIEKALTYCLSWKINYVTRLCLLRIMNSCDEFSTTTNLPTLLSQFSLPCLLVAFKENIVVSSYEYFIHHLEGQSRATGNPGFV